MQKILSYLTAFAVLVTSVTAGILPAKAQYPACGPVKGGNTTFLVCEGRMINHFWSGTKIKVKYVDDNGVNLRIYNEMTGFDIVQYFSNNDWSSFMVGTKNNSGDAYNDYISIDITYLGRDNTDPNRVLIKIDSNTTYEDSLNTAPTPQPEPQSIILPTPQAYSLTNSVNNSIMFSWSDSQGANYYNFQVEQILDNDSYLLVDDVVDVYNTHFDNFVPSSGTGSYRMRVIAKNSSGEASEWSGYIYFNYYTLVENENEILFTPNITYPSQNQKIYHDKSNSQYFGFNLPEQTLYTTWNDVDGVSKYEVYYEKYDNNVWNWYGNFEPNINQDLLSGWIDAGSYRVKVRSVNDSSTSNWSDWTYFEIYNHGNSTTNLGNVAGTDGIYVGYTGMAFQHDLSFINIKVVGYDENYLFLELNNAQWSKMFVKRGQSYEVWNSNGDRGIRVYFDDITDYGVEIHLETVYPQAV